jgi:GMP synthase PP-ATPase subunit
MITMQKVFRNILLLFLLPGFQSPPARHDITVKLRVHGTDDKLTSKIVSDLRIDLGNKSNIIIVSDTVDSSTFAITVQYATLKSGDKLVGFFMNSLLTRTIRTSKDETADMLIKSSVSSTADASDIDRMCTNLIDQYDVQYFEKVRREPAP